MLQAIEHDVQLSAGKEETLRVNLQGDMEPRLHLLREPEGFVLTQATDERGHSLLPAKPENGVQGLRMFARLAVPADMGKKITMLSGTVNYALQTKSETIEIDLAKMTEPLVKEVAGLQVTVVASAVRTPQGMNTVALTYRRTTLAAERWPETAKALAAAEPLLIMEKGNETRWPLDRNGKIEGDVVTHNWDFNFGTGAGGGMPASKLVLTLPLETRMVTVPFAFKDLPLP